MKTIFPLRLFFPFSLCYLGSIGCSLARYTAVEPEKWVESSGTSNGGQMSWATANREDPKIYSILQSGPVMTVYQKNGLSGAKYNTQVHTNTDKIFNIEVAAEGTIYIAYRTQDSKIMLSKEPGKGAWSASTSHSWKHKQINTDNTFTFDFARVKCSADGTPHLFGYSKALGMYFYQKGELLCPVYKVSDANKDNVGDNLHLLFASSDAEGEEPFFGFDDDSKALSCQLKKTDTRILKSSVKEIATLGGSKQFLMTLDPSSKPAFLVPISSTQFKVVGENFEDSLKKSLETTSSTTIARHQSITLSQSNGIPVGFTLTLDADQTNYTLASGAKTTFRAYVPTIFVQYPSKTLVKLVRTPSLWKLNEYDTTVKNRNGWSEEINLGSSFSDGSIAFCLSDGVLYATSVNLPANKIISDPTVNTYVEDILNKSRVYGEKLNVYNTHKRVYNAVQNGFSSYFQRLNSLCQSIASENNSFTWDSYQTAFRLYSNMNMWSTLLTTLQVNDYSSSVYKLITTHPYKKALSIGITNPKNIIELEVAHRKILAAHVKRMWDYTYKGMRTTSTQLFNTRSIFMNEYTGSESSQPFRNRGTTKNCHQWLSWKASSMVAEFALALQGNPLQGYAPAGIRCELFGAMYYSLVQNVSYVFDKVARTPTSHTAQSLAAELYHNLISDAEFFLDIRNGSSSDPNCITGHSRSYFSLAGYDLTIDGYLRKRPKDFVRIKLNSIESALRSAYNLNSNSLSYISTAERECNNLMVEAAESINKPLKLIDPTWQGQWHVYDHPDWADQHARYGIAWLVKDYLLAGARWAYNIWNQEGSSSVKGFPCLDEVNAIKTEVDESYNSWKAAETQLKNYLKGQ